MPGPEATGQSRFIQAMLRETAGPDCEVSMDSVPSAVLLSSRAARMDRHCATRRLTRLAEQAGGLSLPR